MTDVSDWMGAYPTPRPPGQQRQKDPAVEALRDEMGARAARMPGGGRGRSMRLVDSTVCRFPCTEHDHVGPVFIPQPDLDEIGVGWTPQHMPRDVNAWKVPQRCILCWETSDDLTEHKCEVLVVVNG